MDLSHWWPIPKAAHRHVLGACVLTVLVALCVCSCGFLPESSFELAKQSRLPRWFELPPGMARQDMSVTMDYYTSPFGDTVTFTLTGPRDRTIEKVHGRLPPERHLDGQTGYPAYEVIVIHGITEIVEHRKMEPIFYLSDDPGVRRSLASAK